MSEHTITLMRDDDRMGHHYGQHYYVERSGNTVIKMEYIGPDPLKGGTYDRDEALAGASAAARIYGAKLIDRRPHLSLYGWSAD